MRIRQQDIAQSHFLTSFIDRLTPRSTNSRQRPSTHPPIHPFTQHKRTLTIAIGLTLALGLLSSRTIAADDETVLLLTDPLEVQSLRSAEERQQLINQGVVTPDTISQTGLTIPSLWWAQQQYGGNLLEYWFAFPEREGVPPRVDLLVNQQVWNNTDYLAQYGFLLRFGRVSEEFGYSTRVFNGRGELLGAYICSSQANSSSPASTATSAENASDCRIFLSPAAPNAFLNPAAPLITPQTAP